MDKKIGKALILAGVLFATGLVQAVSVSLRVSDHQGNVLQQAGIGVPFLVQVEVITEGRQESARPHLTLPANVGMAQLGTTSSVRTVNSDTVSKKTYQYSAVCNEEGPLVVGPATVLLPNGKEVASNSVKVTVSGQQKSAQISDQTDAFVEMSADTLTPYVGQAVALTLRFYYASDAVHLEQLQEPVFKDCKAAPLQGPTNGHATVKGNKYGYLEWKTTLFPSRVGKMSFPAIAAYITVPVAQPRGRALDMFAMVNQMFGGGKQEQLYSNALTLTVLPLPPGGDNQDVRAVGKFTSFNAKLGSDKAQTGEGIAFTLELVGEGNFAMIGHPALELPEGLKYYDSHAKEHTLSEKMRKKDFEYVLQAVTPGVYEIPAQSFSYFDSKTKSYKTIVSRPVKMTVAGEHKKQVAQVLQPEQEEHQEKVQATRDTDDDLTLERTLRGSGSIVARAIPWHWFFVCVAFLLVLLTAQGVRLLWVGYKTRNAGYFKSKTAFAQAQQTVKAAKQNKEGGRVYHIFMDLFEARFRIPKAELSEQSIEKKLQEAGFSDEQILAWRRFFANTLAATFAVLPESEDMYVQAEQWLMLLERVL